MENNFRQLICRLNPVSSDIMQSRQYLLLLLLPVLLFTITGCNKSNQTSEQSKDKQEFNLSSMSASKLKQWKEDHSYPFAIVDIRTRDAYENGHIYQADRLNPSSEATRHVLKELDRSRPRVVYDASIKQSQQFVSRLKKEGFQNVFYLKGGIQSWKDAGFSLTGKKLQSQKARRETSTDSNRPALLEDLNIQPNTYDRLEQHGETVPLIPIRDAQKLFGKNRVYFVDARGIKSYRKLHIQGAYPSPAGYVNQSVPNWNDPVQKLPEKAIIITYCGCPHHLSSIRASHMIKNGYKHVFALDEGFNAWKHQQLPMSSGPYRK